MANYHSPHLTKLVFVVSASFAVALLFAPMANRLFALQEIDPPDIQQGANQATSGINSADDDFLTLRKRIRELDNEMNRMFVNLPVGFPREQQAHFLKIEELKLTQTDLREKLDAAAIASFRADPERNFQAASHIGQMLVANLEGKSIGKAYDPQRAIELAELLIEKANPNPQLYGMGYSAAFAMQDFDKAELMLGKLSELGQVLEPELFKDIENIKKQWQSELEIRQQETEANDLPIVKLELPNGTIQIELFENQAPETVANFISLVDAGFYDGRSFFQVRPGQIARAGCPDDDGNGNPNYQITKESVDSPRNFFSGTLGMFHSGDGLAGSQFFVSYGPRVNFERDYVAFGRITEGLDLLFALKRAEPQSELIPAPEGNLIVKAEVVRKRDHEYQFNKIAIPALPAFDSSQSLGIGNNQSNGRDVAPPNKNQ